RPGQTRVRARRMERWLHGFRGGPDRTRAGLDRSLRNHDPHYSWSRAMKSRIVLVPLFLLALTFGYRATVPPLTGTRTEEGQRIAFNRSQFQQRELSKRLPLDQPWPAGPELAKALARYGLDKNPPPRAPVMPSQIARDVYLVGQGALSNLT